MLTLSLLLASPSSLFLLLLLFADILVCFGAITIVSLPLLLDMAMSLFLLTPSFFLLTQWFPPSVIIVFAHVIVVGTDIVVGTGNAAMVVGAGFLIGGVVVGTCSIAVLVGAAGAGVSTPTIVIFAAAIVIFACGIVVDAGVAIVGAGVAIAGTVIPAIFAGAAIATVFDTAVVGVV